MIDQSAGGHQATVAIGITGGMVAVVQEGDDGLGAFVARGAYGVPRRPVDGGHGAADAAVHASSSLRIGNGGGGGGGGSKVAIAVCCVRI